MPDNQQYARPSLAASVLILRNSPPALEVLMVRRRKHLRSFAGFWVFPGGSVDAGDSHIATVGGGATLSESERVLRATAVRETFEETGILLVQALAQNRPSTKPLNVGALINDRRSSFSDILLEADCAVNAAQLRPWARWITPSAVPRRYDTHFFLISASGQESPLLSSAEIDDLAWIRVSAGGYGNLPDHRMAHPTQCILRELADHAQGCDSLDALIEQSVTRAIHPVMPKLISRNPITVAFPWDPHYSEIPGDSITWPPAAMLARSNWPSRVIMAAPQT